MVRKSASASSNRKAENSKEEAPKAERVLQAVVIADAAEVRFRPLTLTTPRCLLPLVNVPIIEYTLEFLATNSVQEVFIFVKSHADAIKQYLSSSKWCRPRSRMKVTVMMVPEAHGVGDVLRELDAKSLIDTDFILVSGNVVSNMQLTPVLNQHRWRRERNKDAIMTMVMKQAGPNHRTRAVGETAVLAINPLTQECLMYDSSPYIPAIVSKRNPKLAGSARVELDLEAFKKCSTLQLRDDLIDCQIDICSVEVPALFTENFDYQDIRRHFVHGILTSDLLKNQIHVHVIEDEYAARIRSTQTYDAVSRDIICRWTFPLVIDSLSSNDEPSAYQHGRGHVYKQPGVYLSRSAQVGERVVFGGNCKVGARSLIADSSLGRDCLVGKNTKIIRSYLWGRVQVGSNCFIQHAILADNVVVLDNSIVERGCIIGQNVVVGPDIHLKPFTKLTDRLPEDFVDDAVIDKEVVGEGRGYVWQKSYEFDEEEDDDDACAMDSLISQMYQIGFRVESDLNFSEFDASLEIEHMSEVSSVTEAATNKFYASEDEGDEYSKHLLEVSDTFRRAISENHTIDNAILELNALKMACNINFHDIRVGLVASIIQVVASDMVTIESKADQLIETWAELLQKFSSSTDEQLDLISVLFSEMTNWNNSSRVLHVVLMACYQNDIIDEDAILKWRDDNAITHNNGSINDKLYSVFNTFAEWLENAESESESSSDS